jgi:putative transposase
MLKHSCEFSIEKMARILGVSREGFRKHLKSKGRASDPQLESLVLSIYKASGKRYGAPKICDEIRGRGIPVSRKTVAKIMKNQGIQGVSRRRAKPRTTNSDHDGPIAPNRLNRMFDCGAPNAVWVADIAYRVPGIRYRHLAVSDHECI